MSEKKIGVFKVIEQYGLIKLNNGLSARCLICGVTSNLYPDYSLNESGTNVVHRLSYCDHIFECGLTERSRELREL